MHCADVHTVNCRVNLAIGISTTGTGCISGSNKLLPLYRKNIDDSFSRNLEVWRGRFLIIKYGEILALLNKIIPMIEKCCAQQLWCIGPLGRSKIFLLDESIVLNYFFSFRAVRSFGRRV